MKTLLTFALLLIALSLQAATFITAAVTVTNTAGVTNGTLTVNGDVRTWTNAVTVPGTEILGSTNRSTASMSMLSQAAAYPFTGIKLSLVPYGMKLHAPGNSNLVVSVSAGWGTVTLATNTGIDATVLTLPLSDANETILRGAIMVNDFPYVPMYPSSSGTNCIVNFDVQEFKLTVTNNVYLASSTNWPAPTSTRFTGMTIKGDTTDRLLTWNTNWHLLGATNLASTIPSNAVMRVAFGILGLGETNVMFALPVGSIDATTASNIAAVVSAAEVFKGTNALGAAAWLSLLGVTNIATAAGAAAAQAATNNLPSTYLGLHAPADYVSGSLTNPVFSTNIVYSTFNFASDTNSITLNNGYWFYVATNDCAVTSIVVSGTSPCWAVMTVSNSTASPITFRNTSGVTRLMGLGTNALSIASGKLGSGTFNFLKAGLTNYTTDVEQ